MRNLAYVWTAGNDGHENAGHEFLTAEHDNLFD